MRRTPVAMLGLVLGSAPLLGMVPAGAVAPTSLAVFSAESSATPVGLITRVPAESPGGLVLSASAVRLGKSLAQAAGGTLGPLGDAFLITSAPPGTVAAIPTVVNAQDPPSDGAPREARFEQSQEAGPVKGVLLKASASNEPRAAAEASGSASDAGVVRTGASTSSSTSSVAPDGTVTTVARTDVQDVVIGVPGAPALTFASVSSIASVTVPPGAKPVSLLQVRISGAQLAGVPVTVDQDGVAVAGNVAVPASSFATVNEALRTLAAQGVVLSAVPTVREQGPQGARISGAVLKVRYTVPEVAVPRPSDVGSDEEVLLGSVRAAATARPRRSLTISPELPPSLPQDGPAPATTIDRPGDPVGTDLVPTQAPVETGLAAAPEVSGPAPVEQAAPVGFSLPARTSNAAVEQLLASYRMFLVAAALGVGGLLASRRSARRTS